MSVISALLNCNKIYNFSDAFGVKDITTAEMQEAIKLWLTMYFDHKDKELDDCQRLPVLIVNKLVKTAFSEYSASSENTFAQSVLEDIEKRGERRFSKC